MQVNILKADSSVDSMMRDVLNKEGVVPHEFSCHAHVREKGGEEERNRFDEFTSLRRLLAGLCLVPRCSLVRPFSAIEGPFELLGAVKQALPRIPG